jgi:cytochrome P450
MTSLETTDITSAAHKAAPEILYARLRASKPICKVMLPTKQEAWLVTRYSDVSKLLKDPLLVKDPANAMSAVQLAKEPRPPKFFAPLLRNMLGMDDPDHARLKRLVQAGFTPKRVAGLAGQTELVADQLLFGLKGRSSFDLIDDFALALPVTVISELLGVPKKDQARFARWSQALLTMPIGSWRMVFSMPAIVQFMMYLRYLVDLKRKEPQDDLVSALVVLEADGESLNGDELLAMIAILLSAGHETTTNLIGNGMLTLMSDRENRDRLAAEPEIMDSAIEELLRFAGPVETSTPRYAKEEMEILDHKIARGDIVLGAIASANHDATQFADADKINLTRSPNRHLTFGEGGHYCVGAALARMEGRVAFTGLLSAMPNLRLAKNAAAPEWRTGMVLRGMRQMRVENP